MMECKLADGTVLTTEDIERESAEYESGMWEGKLERIHVGPPLWRTSRWLRSP